MKVIKVYSGISIQDKCGKELHPVEQVKHAEQIILSDKDEICYSNGTDFISAIKYYGIKYNIKTEFYLNGEYCGDDIEPLFNDFNISLDMINEIIPEE